MLQSYVRFSIEAERCSEYCSSILSPLGTTLPLHRTRDLSCPDRLSICACLLPKFVAERNEVPTSCWADPTRSARGPLVANLAAFWQQISPIVPVLPTVPAHKSCAVYNLAFEAFHGIEEVIGSIPIRSTKTPKTVCQDDYRDAGFFRARRKSECPSLSREMGIGYVSVPCTHYFKLIVVVSGSLSDDPPTIMV